MNNIPLSSLMRRCYSEWYEFQESELLFENNPLTFKQRYVFVEDLPKEVVDLVSDQTRRIVQGVIICVCNDVLSHTDGFGNSLLVSVKGKGVFYDEVNSNSMYLSEGDTHEHYAKTLHSWENESSTPNWLAIFVLD